MLCYVAQAYAGEIFERKDQTDFLTFKLSLTKKIPSNLHNKFDTPFKIHLQPLSLQTYLNIHSLNVDDNHKQCCH